MVRRDSQVHKAPVLDDNVPREIYVTYDTMYLLIRRKI